MTRDDRIALAYTAIGRCLGPSDQLDPVPVASFEQPGVVVFQVLTPSEQAASDLGIRVAKALLDDVGFGAVSFGPHRATGDGFMCSIRVLVGAP